MKTFILDRIRKIAALTVAAACTLAGNGVGALENFSNDNEGLQQI
jgi:hypothetical protein